MDGVEITALTTLVGLMIWYLKFQTRQNVERENKSDKERATREEKHDEQQKEERNYYRGLINKELKENATLNNKNLTLQKGMMKDLKDHNGHSEKFSEKVIKTLSLQTDAITLVCHKLNGGSHSMTEAKRKLNKDRRKRDIKVNEERRI